MTDWTGYGDNIVPNSGFGMNLATLLKWYRHYSNEVRIPDTSATVLDAYTLLMAGYRMYARKTLCFPVSYTKAATPSTSIYNYSDFGASNAGARIFKLSLVAFDGKPIDCKTRTEMDTEFGGHTSNSWRFQTAGVPRCWIPWGDGQIKLWPTPAAESNIYIEGWETPDPADFDSPTDVPRIADETEQLLIPMYAAAVPQIRDAQNELQLSQVTFGPELIAGWKSARKRIHGSDNETTIFARYAGEGASRPGWIGDGGIINLP